MVPAAKSPCWCKQLPCTSWKTEAGTRKAALRKHVSPINAASIPQQYSSSKLCCVLQSAFGTESVKERFLGTGQRHAHKGAPAMQPAYTAAAARRGDRVQQIETRTPAAAAQPAFCHLSALGSSEWPSASSSMSCHNGWQYEGMRVHDCKTGRGGKLVITQ